MAYTLETFCADLRAAVSAQGLDALPAVAENLHRLLTNPDFVAGAVNESMPPGRYQLAHD